MSIHVKPPGKTTCFDSELAPMREQIAETGTGTVGMKPERPARRSRRRAEKEETAVAQWRVLHRDSGLAVLASGQQHEEKS
jgi:hypothetical protein